MYMRWHIRLFALPFAEVYAIATDDDGVSECFSFFCSPDDFILLFGVFFILYISLYAQRTHLVHTCIVHIII